PYSALEYRSLPGFFSLGMLTNTPSPLSAMREFPSGPIATFPAWLQLFPGSRNSANRRVSWALLWRDSEQPRVKTSRLTAFSVLRVFLELGIIGMIRWG